MKGSVSGGGGGERWGGGGGYGRRRIKRFRHCTRKYYVYTLVLSSDPRTERSLFVCIILYVFFLLLNFFFLPQTYNIVFLRACVVHIYTRVKVYLSSDVAVEHANSARVCIQCDHRAQPDTGGREYCTSENRVGNTDVRTSGRLYVYHLEVEKTNFRSLTPLSKRTRNDR